MRILPILTALAVCTVLYFLVLERDMLSPGNAAPAAPAAGAEATEAPAPTVAGDGRVSVAARRFVAQTVSDAVVLRGRTEASRSVEVRAETSGKVISEPVRAGATVTAGQVLCRLDEGTRIAQLAEAEARLADAQLNYRNAEALQKGGFAAETRTVATRAALQGAEAAVEAARREIARLTITAPFAGVLENDTAELGSLLQPGGLCGRVIQLDPIHLVGFAPEADIARVAPGAIAGGRLVDGREVAGTVSFVARSSDPATRTFRVEITVPNPDSSIRDGQTAEIAITTPGRPAHLLPGSALTLNDAGTLGVRLVGADDRATFAPVQVLRDAQEGFWVAGLPPEATVITVGQEYVVDGVALDVTLQESAP